MPQRPPEQQPPPPECAEPGVSKLIDERAIVPQDCRSQRLDQVAAQLFPGYSRSQLQQWIKSAQLTLNGRAAKSKEKLAGGEHLLLQAELQGRADWQPQAMALDIVYEDEHILVINKPAGLVVHPAAGNHDGTLLNALLAHNASQAMLPRAGIVHRLDKDTTGLMVVAKTLASANHLVAQLQARTVSRQYVALVMGCLTGGGTVNEPIGRHPNQRTKMAVVRDGKPAVSHYRILKRFANHTLLQVNLETGRTHQIRVHMAYLRHPLVGDGAYAGRFKIPQGAGLALLEQLKNFPRQALHAERLALQHPHTQQDMSWQAPVPDDINNLLSALSADEQS